MIYHFGLTLLFIVATGGLHALLKNRIRWQPTSNQALLFCLSPVPYGILAFMLGMTSATAPFSAGLNLAIMLLLVFGLFLFSLRHETYWAICYLPVTIMTFCVAVNAIYYLTHVREGIAPDPFTLPEPLNTLFGYMFSLNFYLLMAIPVITVISVLYHWIFKKQSIRLHKDVWHIIGLLAGVVVLNWMSALVLAGVVGSAD